MRYHFGPFTLDPAARELLVDAEPIELEPRTFDVLDHLVRHCDRVVPKEELLDEVWGDRFVTESALTTQIKHLRNALGDDGQAQAVIRTVHRVGYRFVAELVVRPTAPDPTATTTGGAGRRLLPRWRRSARLVGRDGDVDHIAARLADHRLVTVTGPAGVGKTSVVAAVMERISATMRGGVWFCELATTSDPDTVAQLVLDSVGEGQHSDTDALESLLRALEPRRGLLVLDNCEHVVDRVRTLVSALNARCLDLHVMTTSRRVLGLALEWVYPLEPLDRHHAVTCFAAKAAESGIEVDLADPAIGELCERLDGLPLALELAAAHARVLSPGQMVDLLADRFRLLRGGPVDADPRHRSLREAIGWSWETLSHADRALLARLSVFVGEFGLADAQAVAMPDGDPLDVVDALGRLVGRSLVVPVAGGGGETRFRLLDSIRDFAAGQSDDPGATRRRHARHFAARAERLDGEFQTPTVDRAIGTMRATWPNLRAAVSYAADEGDRRTVRRIVRAVGPYADVFQIFEVLDWCERAGLDDVPPPPDAPDEVVSFADTLAVQARLLAHRGDHDEARRLAAEAHQLIETHATLLSVLWCAYYAGELDVVVELAHRLVGHCRSDRGFDRGFADGFEAIVMTVRQEPDTSASMVSPRAAFDGMLGVQDCLTAGLRTCTTDPERAVVLLEAVVESALQNDYRLHLGAAASTLTQIALPGRPPGEAMQTLRRTLRRYLDRNMWVLISADTVMAAKLLAEHGDDEVAARLIGARNASGYAVGLSEALRATLQSDLEARLGDRFEALAGEGARWRPPDAGRAAIDALGEALGR